MVLRAAAAWGVFNAAYVTHRSFGSKALEDLGQTAIVAAGLGARLLFGLIEMALAGVIMAVPGYAMRPQVRAIGLFAAVVPLSVMFQYFKAA